MTMLPVKRRKTDEDRPTSLDMKKKKSKHIVKEAVPARATSSPSSEPENVEPEREDLEEAEIEGEKDEEIEAPKSFKDLVCGSIVFKLVVADRIYLGHHRLSM